VVLPCRYGTCGKTDHVLGHYAKKKGRSLLVRTFSFVEDLYKEKKAAKP